MKLLLAVVLPVAVGAICLTPRSTDQCSQLMDAFSQTSTFGFHQSASCFNFCDGAFQNTNSFFFGGPTCVIGCRLADLTIPSSTTVANKRRLGGYYQPSMLGSSNTAAAQVSNPSMTTAYGQVSNPTYLGSTSSLWNFRPSTASAQVTDPSTTTAFGQVSTPAIGSTSVLWNFHPNTNAAPAQVTAPASVSTASSNTVDSNGVRWYLPSNNVASGQVASTQVYKPYNNVASGQVASTQATYPGAAQVYNPYNSATVPAPVPAPQIFVTPARTTGATVTTVSGSNSFAAQQPGFGRISAASISGPGGTVNAVISGAGKAIPFARTNNVASTQISRRSCYRGKMGSCGKMGFSGSRSSVYSYEALASGSSALSPTVAATFAVLLWNVL